MTDIRLHDPDRIKNRSRACTAVKRTTAKAAQKERQKEAETDKKKYVSIGSKKSRRGKKVRERQTEKNGE